MLELLRVRCLGATTLLTVLATGCGVNRDSFGDGGDLAAPADGGDGVSGDGSNGLNGGLDAASNWADSGDKLGPDEPCGQYQIPVTNQTPEVLIVLDRSGSMRPLVGIDRWDPSVAAVEGVVQSLPEVHFGLLTFPGDCGSIADPQEQAACAARLALEGPVTSCEPGRVVVPVAQGSAASVTAALSALAPLGATPTAAAVDTAASSLGALPLTPDTGSRSILLVTDGAPNCELGVGGLLGVGIGPASQQAPAVLQTLDAITRAANGGVKTYVIGYDSLSDPILSTTLDYMAAAGGTGASKHLPVEDQAGLISVLRSLTKRSLLCDLRLKAPADPSLITVTLGGTAVPHDDANGWSLSAGGLSLSLRGAACDAITASSSKIGTVTVECPPAAPPADAGAPDLTDAGVNDSGGLVYQ